MTVPHEQMDEQQIAAYLHMDVRDLKKLASRGQIPCRKVGGAFRFSKGEVDHWVEAQMHQLGPERLAGIGRGVSNHHGIDHEELLICPLVPPQGLAVPLAARTRQSVLRELIEVAERDSLIYNRPELLDEVQKREELCTTAVAPGLAMPHPRHPLPYDIAESFVVVGVTSTGIAFGAEDGSMTRLFFLICCKDERTHLHVLARLALMLHEQAAIDELIEAPSANALRVLLAAREEAALRHKQSPPGAMR
ncbi:MAG: PTS sugar transporter subunit IIA [Planctomycetota bacterium]|nr:PTS sugar transporter subunit IIA [Planctomycetota bacterium]